MEGMRGWVRRHGPSLDRDAHPRRGARDARLAGADPARGRGDDLDDRLRRRACATSSPRARSDAGVPLRRGLRLGFATDALSALRAGLRAATLASCDEYKMPANYHSQRDIPRNVDFETVAAGARASPRRRSGEQRAREADRVLAGADLARVLRLLELARAAGRSRGPAHARARARARRRARAAPAAPRARRASAGPSISRASSRWAAIAGSALRPRVARRSATVKTVTSAA